MRPQASCKRLLRPTGDNLRFGREPNTSRHVAIAQPGVLAGWKSRPATSENSLALPRRDIRLNEKRPGRDACKHSIRPRTLPYLFPQDHGFGNLPQRSALLARLPL